MLKKLGEHVSHNRRWGTTESALSLQMAENLCWERLWMSVVCCSKLSLLSGVSLRYLKHYTVSTASLMMQMGLWVELC